MLPPKKHLEDFTYSMGVHSKRRIRKSLTALLVSAVVIMFLVLHTDVFQDLVDYYSEPEDTPRMRERRLPRAMIAGVRMCGTRALVEFLNLHTWVEFPATQTHFFDNETTLSRGVDWYLRQMPPTLPNQMTIDIEPHYFSDELAPQRISTTMNDTMKIILIFCAPSVRTVTWYNEVIASDVRRNVDETSMDKIVLNNVTGEVNIQSEGVREGLYDKHIQRWYTYFDKKKVHVVDGDMFAKNPLIELRKLEGFLGLPRRIKDEQLEYNHETGLYCLERTQAVSKAGDGNRCIVQKDHMQLFRADITVIKKLFEFFRPLNDQFYKTLGQKFDWAYQKYSNNVEKTLKLHMSGEEV